MRRAPLAAVAAFTIFSLPVTARPQTTDGAPTRSTMTRQITNTIAAALNPPGLQNTITMAWSRPLTTSTEPILKDAHLAFGVAHVMSPCYTRVSPWVEYSPLSILDLRFGVEPTVNFPVFGSFAAFDRYTQDYSWDAVTAQQGQWALAARFYAQPTFKIKIGPIVAFVRGELERWQTNAKGPLVYETWRDTLIRASGATLVSVSDAVLFEHSVGSGRWSAGFTHDLLANTETSYSRIERAGAIFIREFTGKRLGMHEPSFAASVTYYAKDPSKKGSVYAWIAVTFQVRRVKP